MRTPQHYENTSLCFDTAHSQWSICLDSTTQNTYKGAVSYGGFSRTVYEPYGQLFRPLMCCYVPPLPIEKRLTTLTYRGDNLWTLYWNSLESHQVSNTSDCLSHWYTSASFWSYSYLRFLCRKKYSASKKRLKTIFREKISHGFRGRLRFAKDI